MNEKLNLSRIDVVVLSTIVLLLTFGTAFALMLRFGSPDMINSIERILTLNW